MICKQKGNNRYRYNILNIYEYRLVVEQYVYSEESTDVLQLVQYIQYVLGKHLAEELQGYCRKV